ncbi:hypothetical protein QJS66_17175 [Kocuria rhizophila]|nr:hypothetical protein QJS66_17175 [Kocuria rhizophila]
MQVPALPCRRPPLPSSRLGSAPSGFRARTWGGSRSRTAPRPVALLVAGACWRRSWTPPRRERLAGHDGAPRRPGERARQLRAWPCRRGGRGNAADVSTTWRGSLCRPGRLRRGASRPRGRHAHAGGRRGRWRLRGGCGGRPGGGRVVNMTASYGGRPPSTAPRVALTGGPGMAGWRARALAHVAVDTLFDAKRGRAA